MIAHDLAAALEDPAYTPASPPAPAYQPLGAGLSQAVEDCALSLARQHRLLHGSVLHCWHCHRPCPWNVTLHCSDRCRAESRAEGEEQKRRERERALQQRQEQSRPQRAYGRRFGDDE